ncbi:DUF2628 domain-containing protein [Shewanella sp. TB7-MNA-CIBAN-0143]|uniref:DUF2628 domain-containing protein n=1 Tax=unclassified Shewanella TaxID=196818 RepID=UPI003325C68A
MNSFKLVFKGEITEGKDPHKLGQALAKFLKFPEEKAHVLFSGNPICIKNALSESEANALKAKLNAVGIITYIKPVATQAATAAPLATPVAPQQVAKSSTEAKPATATKPTVKSYDDLSKGWQKVFAEFDLRQADKLGYFASAKSPAHTSRPKKEQIKGQNVVNMNALAFVFGSGYYFAKGMWKKGIYLFLMLMLLNLIILAVASLITDKNLSKLPFIINSLVFGLTANYDYYRYYKLGETTWPWMSKWMTGWLGIAGSTIIVILIVTAITYVRMADVLNVLAVKEGYLDDYKQTNIGQAFDKWTPCASTSWTEQESGNGITTVVYTCNMKLKHFKLVGQKAAEAVTGKVDEAFIPQITRASLTIQFLINLDDTFEVNTARWQLSLGEGKEYTPYITANNALDDIYSNSLSKAIGEIFTPENILINQVTK